jgi:hypothetical protein
MDHDTADNRHQPRILQNYAGSVHYELAPPALPGYTAAMKYKHVLALNPVVGHTTNIRGVFPPTGLEYITASMKGLVGKITFLDLRY